MSFIQNLYTSRDNNANAATYVGQQDRIWWDPVTNTFYYSDGNTAGGIPIGISSGNGIPGGPANSVQFNAGGGYFGGSSTLTFNGTTLVSTSNIAASAFNSDAYQYANGVSIFSAPRLGNLYVVDQTIYGTDVNGNINLTPEGSGVVNIPSVGLTPVGTFLRSYAAVGGANPGVELTTPVGADITFAPGATANILTAGNIMPTGNNIAALGQPDHRYTGLWLGAGDINIIDRGIGVNQQWYADEGNIIFGNSSGASFGNFRFYNDTMALANAAANIIIGTANATGWVQFNRAVAVSSQTGRNAFTVDKDGQTQIIAPSTLSPTDAALSIIGSSSGNSQPRSATFTGTLLQLTGQDDTAARVSIDAFGATGAQNSYAAIAARAARGTVDSPTALQANDLMLRLAMQGWTGNGVYAPSIARLNFAAAEAFTSNASVGTYANIQLTPIGTNSIKTVTGFSANGVSFPNAISGGTGNLGITFQDGTFQNTAFSNTQVVTGLTAATGISLTPPGPVATGTITVTNTGVITVAGTSNQVYVNGFGNTAPASGTVVLSLPQDISTNSSPTFNTLNVTNLNITGNVTNVIPSIVAGPIVYVATTATQFSDIDNSGLVTGNVSNNVSAGILYQTTGAYANTWDMTIGNSRGIYAGTIYGVNGILSDGLHLGNAYNNYDFTDATLQVDTNLDSYTQAVLMNHNRGANASSDYVAVANNGDDGSFYIDMGINSNVYANVDYLVTGPNDGYVYVNGGNLVMGTQTPTKVIKFFTGGTNSATAYNRASITDAGLSVAGNIVGNNVSAINVTSGSTISAVGNVIGQNIYALNNINAVGSITGQSLVANTSVTTSGSVVGGLVRSTGNISAAGNIIAGNLVTATTTIDGGVSTTGNVTATNVLVSGNISAAGNITGANIISATQLISPLIVVTGNITGGNLLTSGLISTTGNATFGNITTIGRASLTGNVDAGNLRTAGTVTATTISATGNITSSYFIGNGSQLTGLNAFQTVTANGTNLIAGSTSGVLTMTPGNNIVMTGTALSDTVNIAVNDNPTFANISVTGNITVSGNIFTANTTYLANVGNILYSNTSPLGNAYPGVMEYDGRVLYFTPQDQERGVVPSQEWYVLNADRGLTYGSTTPQSLFGVGAHVSNATRYWFRIKATVSRAAGTNNTALTLGWRGSAVMSKISYIAESSIGAVNTPKAAYQYESTLVANFTNQLSITTGNNPPDSVTFIINGIIDVGATGGGYVEPYISWTGATAPGSVTVSSLSNFQIYPLGATGANTSVGNWG